MRANHIFTQFSDTLFQEQISRLIKIRNWLILNVCVCVEANNEGYIRIVCVWQLVITIQLARFAAGKDHPFVLSWFSFSPILFEFISISNIYDEPWMLCAKCCDWSQVPHYPSWNLFNIHNIWTLHTYYFHTFSSLQFALLYAVWVRCAICDMRLLFHLLRDYFIHVGFLFCPPFIMPSHSCCLPYLGSKFEINGLYIWSVCFLNWPIYS